VAVRARTVCTSHVSTCSCRLHSTTTFGFLDSPAYHTSGDCSQRIKAPTRAISPTEIRSDPARARSRLSALACPPSARYWPNTPLSCLPTSWITRARMERLLSRSWAFVVCCCFSTFPFSFISIPPSPSFRSVSLPALCRISHRQVLPTRATHAHTHTSCGRPHTPHCATGIQSARSHTPFRLTPPRTFDPAAPAVVRHTQAPTRAHGAREGPSWMTRARPAGISARYVVVFEYISTPTCTHIPQQSTPVLTHRFRVLPSPSRASSPPRSHVVPSSVLENPRQLSATREQTRFPSLPHSHNTLAHHPHALAIIAEPLRAHQRSTRSPAAETRPPPPSDSISGHTSPRADIHHRRHTLRGSFSVLPQGRSCQ
jgi:hypothetical protein